MSVFALFFALLLDQFRPLQPHHRLYGMMRAGAHRLRQQLDADTPAQAWLIWALVVAGPAVLVWVVYWLLGHFLGGFFAFLCTLLVLYTCLDFRAFGLHFTEVRNAVNTGDIEQAGEALGLWCDVLERRQQESEATPAQSGRELAVGTIKTSLEHMHRYVFGVFAAFVLLAALGFGPVGAVLFRSACYAYRFWAERDSDSQGWSDSPSPALADVARRGWQVINWLPARISAMMFAVVGRYDEAIGAWRIYSASRPGDADALVLATAVSSMGMPQSMVQQVVNWQPDSEPLEERPLSEDEQSELAEAAAGILHTLAMMIWRVLVLWLFVCLLAGLIDAVI